MLQFFLFFPVLYFRKFCNGEQILKERFQSIGYLRIRVFNEFCFLGLFSIKNLDPEFAFLKGIVSRHKDKVKRKRQKKDIVRPLVYSPDVWIGHGWAMPKRELQLGLTHVCNACFSKAILAGRSLGSAVARAGTAALTGCSSLCLWLWRYLLYYSSGLPKFALP